MNSSFPYRIDQRGRTASSTGDEHLRELIEQLLFTAPGERPMRPGFGSGLQQLVFAPGSTALAATTKQTVHAALQEWLGGRALVEDVEVQVDETVLRVTVRYRSAETNELLTEAFEHTP